MTVDKLTDDIVQPRLTKKLLTLNRAIDFTKKIQDSMSSNAALQGNINNSYTPREDLIRVLTVGPQVTRCKKCTRIIESGDYCQDCAKELIKQHYSQMKHGGK